jgi:hypothetical protein
MLAEWAIFLAVCVSGCFIYQALKEITMHLANIRMLCADINGRGSLEAKIRAHERLGDKADRGGEQSGPAIS